MTIPRISEFDFRFRDGKGIRTNQLWGEYVKKINSDGSIIVQNDDGTESTVTPSSSDGSSPAERVVLAVSDQVVGTGVGSQTGATGVINQVLPADYTDFDNTELIVYDPRNNTTTFIDLRNDWLAIQTDGNSPKLGASDQDEAGSRQWVTWTPSTRTFGRGGQHNTDNNILRITGVRLYDDGGAGAASEVGDGSLTPENVICLLYTSPSPRDS